MPDYLQASFEHLNESEAAASRFDGEFAPVEQIWHLADLECEGFGERIRKVSNEESPLLPDFQGAKLARERNYRSRLILDGLSAFFEARQANLKLLRSLPEEAWMRRGNQEGVGEIHLCDIPVFMAQHDSSHRAEIEAWKRQFYAGAGVGSQIEVKQSNPTTQEAVNLLAELSVTLEQITGCSGSQSFENSDVALPRAIFLVAFQHGNAVGCGALRFLSEETCEIKRMYAKAPSKGVGTAILLELEKYAANFGYKRICLETRVQNRRAVSFYLKNSYLVCENFGRYLGRSECVCFEKFI
jgi:GNAT superfamily N-acetyltransferase